MAVARAVMIEEAFPKINVGRSDQVVEKTWDKPIIQETKDPAENLVVNPN